MTMMPPETALTELSGDLLRARVARAQMYLIYLNEPAAAVQIPEALMEEHRAYLDRLEAEGRLYGYGPLEAVAGDRARELAIVVAESAQDAEGIAVNEPLHRAGHRVNTVQGHTMNEGVACYVARAMSRRAIEAGTRFDPAIASRSKSGLAQRGNAPETQLFLIYLVPTDKPRAQGDTATFDGHFVWLRENEMAARLMSCGPVQPAQPLAAGIWGGGLGIVATSREDAERIAESEPSGQAGYRVLSVRGWRMQHGLAAPIAQALQRLNSLP
jgi:uncharacterized protein YciI